MSESVQMYRLALKKEREVSLAAARIVGPQTARRVSYVLLRDAAVEYLLAIGVDVSLGIVGVVTVATIGSIRSAVVDPAIVAKAALTMNAHGIIIAHNHPSGDPRPSNDDREMTKRLSETMTMIGIPLLDHLIVTREPEKYYSFNETGLIK